MGALARLDTLGHQEYKAKKELVVTEDLEDQKKTKELWDLLVTLDIVNVIRWLLLTNRVDYKVLPITSFRARAELNNDSFNYIDMQLFELATMYIWHAETILQPTVGFYITNCFVVTNLDVSFALSILPLIKSLLKYSNSL